MIRIKCPKCQKVLSIDDALAGTVSSCDACGQKFKVPTPAAKAKAAAAPVKPPEPRKAWQEDDDFTPYLVIKNEEAEKPPEDDRVDQMVKDNFRQKKRQKAWDIAGTPAMLMKAFALLGIGLSLLVFALISLDCILYQFKLKQHLDNPGKTMDYPVPRMFWVDFLDSKPGEAPAMGYWAGAFGVLVVWLALEAITVSGAENLRSLGSYKRAMWGSIVGIITTIPAGVLALMAVLDEKVKLQFPEFKKELIRQETKEWDEMQEQIEEDREDREEAAREGRVYKPRRKRVEKEQRQEAGASSALVLVLGGLAFLVVLCVVAYFVPAVCHLIYLIGWLLSLWGFVQLVIIAFREDSLQGILILSSVICGLMGIYNLYYIITRWQEAKGAFFISLAGTVFATTGIIMMIVTGSLPIWMGGAGG